MTDFTVKIGGEAGFGIMTTGLLFGKLATRSGYHAFEYAEYPSLIRGGHNVVEVRVSNNKVYSQEKKVDILVCLNRETFNLHKDEVKKGGLIIMDFDKEEIEISSGFVNIPFGKMLKEVSLPFVMINNITLGVLSHFLDADFEILKELIAENFSKKGKEIIEKNIEAARIGRDYACKNYSKGYQKKMPKLTKIVPKMYISGNEMFGLGAIAADCKFYAAYPMTPTSTLLHYLAAKAEKSGMVVKHAEDEISVINMALGASWAGVRSMVGTSGGGFALMVEAVSLAGITETPVVIVMGQRPGPATGMPTWTEQGDLLFILHAGHGEFLKIILAPGDVEETYKLTLDAFNLADKYQTPVFLLGDKYLQEGHQSIDDSLIKNVKIIIDRGKLLRKEQLENITEYKRYQFTDDGISPRAIPGYKNSLHQVNSYEHEEDGHTTEDAIKRIKQVDKRNRKYATFLSQDAKMPVLYGKKDAPLTIVSWGSMKGPIMQAMRENSDKFNYLHFSCLWPLPEEKLQKLFKSFERILLVENNSTAQFGQLLRMATGIEIKEKLLKYSGRPFFPEEIIAKINELL